jgi:3',5'-cyclic AMP phosphodiesterase CpdA
MRTIAHLSDLHFGRIEKAAFAALAADVRSLAPDIVVVSGDMTQRARTSEFIEARAFLETLPSPRLVVPGNHDVPLYDVLARALAPLARYRRYIAADTEPFYADAEIAIAGVNTARSLTFKGGRINSAQLEAVKQKFAALPEGTTRIIVTHHPFEGTAADDDEGVVGRARMAMNAFSRDRVDMILSGHLHLNRIGSSAARYNIEGYAALLIQAGTAISSRRRAEANSFNVIRIERPQIEVECRTWEPAAGRFAAAPAARFRRGPAGWQAVGAAAMPTLTREPDSPVKLPGGPERE